MQKGIMLQRVTQRAGLPAESFPGIPLIEIFGRERVLVENHNCIVGYSDSLVEIRVSYGIVRIHGQRLILSSADRRQLIISGNICGLELDKGV